MSVSARGVLLALIAMGFLAGGGAAAQDAAADDETEILEQTGSDDDDTTSEPPPDEAEDVSVTYSGMGLMRVSSDLQNLDDAWNLGAVIGFRIPTVPWFGIEIDLGTTIIPGKNSGAASGGSAGFPGTCDPVPFPGCTPATPGTPGEEGTRSGEDLHVTPIGVSAVFKSLGQFYVVGRVGYRYLNSTIPEINDESGGTGYGGGVGYRWRGLSGVELTYQDLTADVTGISLVFSTSLKR